MADLYDSEQRERCAARTQLAGASAHPGRRLSLRWASVAVRHHQSARRSSSVETPDQRSQ
jgi:hypothetical protein